MTTENKLFVIPNGRVPDPRTGIALPEDGAHVPRNGFWLRRIKDGDVKEAKPPRATSAKSETSTKKD